MEKEENQNNTVKGSHEPDKEATKAEENLNTDKQKSTDENVEFYDEISEENISLKIVINKAKVYSFKI